MEPADKRSTNDQQRECVLGPPDPREVPAPETILRIVIPDTLNVHISFDGMPEVPSVGHEEPKEHKSQGRLGDLLENPLVKKGGALLLTFVAGFFSSKGIDQLTRDTFDKITTEFVEKKGDTNIAAIKIAAYGDKALPAVRMALASEDEALRNGGVLIAQQMFVQKKIDHKKLVDEMWQDYENPAMQRGVIQWFEKMNGALSNEEGKRVLTKLTLSFKADGRDCVNNDENVAAAAAGFLLAWSLPDSSNLALGMVGYCPKEWVGVRETALSALPRIAAHIPKKEQDSILGSLEQLRTTESQNGASEEDKRFAPKISRAIGQSENQRR